MANKAANLITREAQRISVLQQQKTAEYLAKQQQQAQAALQQQQAQALTVAQRAVLTTQAAANVQVAGARPVASAPAVSLSPDDQSRVAELTNAIAYSEQVKAGVAQLPEGTNEADYWNSVQDVQNKLDIINSYINAGVPIPDAAKSLVLSKLSPFIDTVKGTIDVDTALKAGVNPNELKVVGIADTVIQAAGSRNEARNVLMKYQNDPVKAIEGGDIDSVRVLYGNEPTLNLQIAIADVHGQQAAMAMIPKEAFDAGGRLLLDKAAELNVPVSTLRTAGYDVSNKQYQQVQKDVSLLRTAPPTPVPGASTMVSQAEFDTWITGAGVPQVLKDAYTKGGYQEYQSALARYTASQDAALAAIKPYVVYQPFVGPLMTGQTRENVFAGYDINNFVAKSPDRNVAIATLTALGFQSNDIQQAQNYAAKYDAANGIVDYINSKVIPGMTALQPTNDQTKDAIAFRLVMQGAGYETDLVNKWRNADDDTKRSIAASFAADPYRKSLSAEFLRSIDVAASQNPVQQILASPYLGVTHVIGESMVGKKPSTWDIAGAGLTVVGDVLMLGGAEGLIALGRGGLWTLRGVTTSMGTIQAAQLSQDFGKMNNAQRVIGVTTDALLFVPIASAAVKGLTAPGQAKVMRSQIDNALSINREIVGRTAGEGAAGAYTRLTQDVKAYADARTDLALAQRVVNDIGFPKTQAEADLLARANATIDRLTGQTPLLDIPAGEAGIRPRPEPAVNQIELLRGNVQKSLQDYNAQALRGAKLDTPTLAREMDITTRQAINRIDTTIDNIVGSSPELPKIQEAIMVAEEGKVIARQQLDPVAAEQVVAQLNAVERQLGKEQSAQLRVNYLRDVARGEYVQSQLVSANDRLAVIGKEKLSTDADVNAQLSQLKNDISYLDSLAATLEFQTFEGVQYTTVPIYGKESYAGVLEKLRNALDDMARGAPNDPNTVNVVLSAMDAAAKGDVPRLNAAIRLLELQAGKIPDRPLQLKAVEQVKLIKAYGQDLADMFKPGTRFVRPDAGAGIPSQMLKATLSDIAETRSQAIQRQVENIISARYEKLTRFLPEQVLTRKPDEIMAYLAQRFDPAYFETAFDGQFKDINDYLDVDRVRSEIEQEIAEQERQEKLKQELETYQIEKDLTDKFKDRSSNPDLKKKLDDRSQTLEQQITEKKVEIAEQTKKLVIPTVRIITPEEAAKFLPAKKTSTDVSTPKAEPVRPTPKTATPFRLSPKTTVTVVRRDGTRVQDDAEHIGAMTPEQARRLYGEEVQLEDAIGQPISVTRSGRIQVLQPSKRTWLTPSQAVRAAQKLSQQASQQASQKEAQQRQEQLSRQDKLARQAQTKAQTATQLQTETRTGTETKLATTTKVEPVTVVAPSVEIKTPVTTIIPPPVKPPPPPPPKPPTPTPPSFEMGGELGKGRRELPVGSVAWKQGYAWKWILPEDFTSGAKPRTLAKGVAPLGAIHTEGRTPSETIQVIGGGAVPKNIMVDLGIEDIEILDGRAIMFSGGGVGTDVGTRITSSTRGMSVNEDGGDGDWGEVGIPAKRRGLGKGQGKVKRKRKAISEFDYMTTLKGFKVE